jgi:hypothetical protein
VRKLKQREGESDEDFAKRSEESWNRQLETRRRRTRERLKDPVQLEKKRAYQRKYMKDPEFRRRCVERNRRNRQTEEGKVARREYAREHNRRLRAPPEDHPGTCEICGVDCPPQANGRDSLYQDHRHDNNVIRGWLCNRCNVRVAVLDLAFTDPDYFAALKAWSLKGAPVVPTRSESPKRRRVAPEHPSLFGGNLKR